MVRDFSDIGEKYENNEKKNCDPIGGNNVSNPAGKFAGLGGTFDTTCKSKWIHDTV